MKAALLLTALALAACSTSASSTPAVPGAALTASGGVRETHEVIGGAPNFRLQIALFDAPLPMANVKVNVGIDAIQLLTPIGAVPFITNKTSKVVNLLDLQDSALTFNGAAPAGAYTGVRWVINSANSSVTVNGMKFPIVWGSPGHPTTSPVIAVDAACAFGLGGISKDAVTKVAVDFNVLQSVRFVNGTIYVEPSLTAANAAGSVGGTVKNAAGKPVSSATVIARDVTGATVNVTTTKSDGKFALHALSPGYYTIAVQNSFVTKAGYTVTASGADAGAAPSAPVYVSPDDDVELNTLTD